MWATMGANLGTHGENLANNCQSYVMTQRAATICQRYTDQYCGPWHINAFFGSDESKQVWLKYVCYVNLLTYYSSAT